MDERVLIVGGGPAGQAAAVTLARYGIAVAVIDEQPRPGGQILRRPTGEGVPPRWMTARTYRDVYAGLAAFEAADGITWLGGRSVLGLAQIDGLWQVTTVGTDGVGARVEATRHVLVAAGCQDLPVPLPGWTLPGVYGVGGLQTLLKTQGTTPARRIVLAGTHPLLLIVAHQLIAAGCEVAAVLFAQPRHRILRGLRAGLTALHRSADIAAALAAAAALRRAGVPLRFSARIEQIVGDDAVRGVTVDGATIACDGVGLGYGFVPQAALLRMAGAAVRPASPAGGFACVVDPWMRSSRDGLWAAGEVAGVAGAGAAAAEGTIAAIGIAQAIGRLDDAASVRAAADAQRARRRHRRFAAMLDALADPTGLFPSPEDDMPVCRCEGVAWTDIAAARAAGAVGADAIKLATRCGMGLCQGRNCEPTLLRLLGDADDPGFAARFPARPVPIAALAALD